jgi:protein TonB
VPPLEQPVPVIVEPLPQVAPTTTDAKESDQQNDDDKPQAPQIQVVTLETPAINFAVPTPGSLLVPMSVAPTPVEVALKRAAPVKQEPTRIQSSGAGGDRPAPEYPKMALQLSEQGDVTLLLTVNDYGKVVSTEIKESSGSPILDANAQEWVKRRWSIPPINGGHLFQVTFKFHIKSI